MRFRLLVVAAVMASIAGATVVGAGPAYGCSCIEMTVNEAINATTTAAFIGTPVAVEERADGGALVGDVYVEPMLWTFEVETVLKGDVPAVVQIGSGYGGGDCGYDFSTRGRVGVVAYGADGNLATGSCGGVWDAEALLAAFGPGTEPLASSPAPADGPADRSPPTWFWVVVAGASLTALVLVIIGRRRGDFQDGWSDGAGE